MRILWLAALALAGFSAMANEKGLQALSESVHQSLVHQGRVLNDPELASVSARLLERLRPAHGFQVVTLNDPQATAFSLPDGRIYLAAGLMLVVDNEDELAFVLAHEAAHIQFGHTAQRLHRDARQIDDQYALDLEQQADQQALKWVSQAGFEPAIARPLLSRLGQWQHVGGRDDPTLAARLAALPDGRPRKGQAIPELIGLRRMVVQQLLVQGDATQLARCLTSATCGQALSGWLPAVLESTLERLSGQGQAALARLVGEPDRPAVIRARALALEVLGECQSANGWWSRLLDEVDAALIARETDRQGCGQPKPWIPTRSPVNYPVNNDQGQELAMTLVTPWLGQSSKDGARFTRDGFSIQRLDLTIHSGKPDLPVLNDLDKRLRDWHTGHPNSNARLINADAFANGYQADLQHRDDLGLRWSTRLYGFQMADHRLLAEFRAPSLYYFERDVVVVERMLLSLRPTRNPSNE
jgi:hypothetical protein